MDLLNTKSPLSIIPNWLEGAICAVNFGDILITVWSLAMTLAFVVNGKGRVNEYFTAFDRICKCMLLSAYSLWILYYSYIDSCMTSMFNFMGFVIPDLSLWQLALLNPSKIFFKICPAILRTAGLFKSPEQLASIAWLTELIVSSVIVYSCIFIEIVAALSIVIFHLAAISFALWSPFAILGSLDSVRDLILRMLSWIFELSAFCIVYPISINFIDKNNLALLDINPSVLKILASVLYATAICWCFLKLPGLIKKIFSRYILEYFIRDP